MPEIPHRIPSVHARLLAFVLMLPSLGACAGLPDPVPPTPPPLDEMALMHEAEVRVTVDRVSRTVTLLTGPYHVPAAETAPALMGAMSAGGAHAARMEYGGAGHADLAHRTPLIRLVWPVEGDFAGFTLRVYDAKGRELSRHILHHLIGVNFSRRQLAQPMAERLFAIGTETDDVLLPSSLGVPLHEGDSIGMYASWHNDTGADLHGVFAQITLPYYDPDPDRELAVPIWMDANNRIGETNSFDLAPGRTVHSHEFQLPVGGALLAVGGHLHDHGVEVRLEDAENGEVLVRLRPELDAEGRVAAVEQKIFRKWLGLADDRLRMEAGRRYRVIGVYENPTDALIPEGGMAHISGIFVVDDFDAIPPLDRSSELHVLDLMGMPVPAYHSHEFR